MAAVIAAPDPAIGAPRCERPVDWLAAHALADDPDTLSAAHPVNAALRDAGAGTVPRLLALDHRRRVATLACEPLCARLELPFGWHAIEDSRHLALFEPGRQVQMQLRLLVDARDPAAVLDEIELQACGQRPAPDALRLRDGPLHVLALRGLLDGFIPHEQYHLVTHPLTPVLGPCTLLHARVTNPPQRGRAVVELVEALLAGIRFERREDAATPGATNETQPGLR